ncbi:MAG: metallophosphoesterase [Lachnospiraceae bacterium]|nr:metallophosphoesterase [Lachnospiraceae bacterium]
MKILIVSDSHGRDRHVAMALDREWPVDAMIHLGDSQEDEDEFSMILAGEDVPLYMVRGNCDYDYNLAPFRIVELEGHRILMTHGHMQNVGSSNRELADLAIENNCGIALYGHTHRPEIDEDTPGLLILNPGSISLPRQRGREKSYMVLELENGKKPEAELRYFRD